MSTVYPLIILTPSGVNVGTSTLTYSAPSTIPTNQPLSVMLENPGLLPAPLAADVTYFAVNVTSTTLQLSLTSGGAAIPLTSAGSGNMSLFASQVPVQPPSPVEPTAPVVNPIYEALHAGRYPARRFNQRERKLVQSVTSYSPGAVVAGAAAGYATQPTTIEGALDQLASQGSGGLAMAVLATYDFTVNGGTIGTIPLGVTIPAGAIITQVTSDIVVATTGTSGGTLTLNLTTDGNIALPITTPASISVVDEDGATGSTTLPKKTTGARAVNAVIATHALTAGKVYFYIRYVQSSAT
jgi:hypothetical protein